MATAAEFAGYEAVSDEMRTSDIALGCQNLDRFGFTIHEDFLPPEALAAALARFDEQAEMEGEQGVATYSYSGHAGKDRSTGMIDADNLPPYQQIDFLPNKGQEFLDIVTHQTALAYCEHAFRGVPFNLSTSAGMMVRSGSETQIMHADQQAWPFPTTIPVLLNVMTCLSDFEADMGATRIVPGSHRLPPPDMTMGRDEALDKIGAKMIPMTAKAGSALVWESRTWHCAWRSVSPKPRKSIVSVYAVHFAKPQDFYPAIIHDDVYERLTEHEKQVLGFEVKYEYAGRIGPRRPDDVRTNTNAHYPFIPELRRGGTNRAVPLEKMGVALTDVLPTQVS